MIDIFSDFHNSMRAPDFDMKHLKKATGYIG